MHNNKIKKSASEQHLCPKTAIEHSTRFVLPLATISPKWAFLEPITISGAAFSLDFLHNSSLLRLPLPHVVKYTDLGSKANLGMDSI